MVASLLIVLDAPHELLEVVTFVDFAFFGGLTTLLMIPLDVERPKFWVSTSAVSS